MKRFETLEDLLAYLQGLDEDEQDRVCPELDTAYDLPFMTPGNCPDEDFYDPIWAWSKTHVMVGDCIRDMTIEVAK